MLQSSRATRSVASSASAPEPSLSFADFRTGIMQSRWLIVALLGMSVSTGIVVVKRTTPIYVANAEILIDPKGTQQDEGPGVASAVETGEVESQMEVLRSTSISLAVIRDQNLVDDPEFLSPDGTPAERLSAAAGQFAERLSVRRVGQSYAIEVSFRTGKPEKSARIANAVVAAYLSGRWRLSDTVNTRNRFSGNAQEATISVANARVITPAVPPLWKSAPKTKVILALSAIIGLSAGIGIALIRQVLHPRIRSERDLKQAGDIVCLGSVPELGRRQRGFKKAGIAVIDAPRSSFADALRSACFVLGAATSSSGPLCIGVSGLRCGDGATTILTNIAALAGQRGDKALVVDANFGDPELTRRFVPQAKAGLVELLNGGGEECLFHDARLGFHIVPLAGATQSVNSADLLRSNRMRKLLESLRANFSLVLFDLPPFTECVDTRALGPLLDDNLLIVKAGDARPEDLRETIGTMETMQVPLLGALLNRSSSVRR
jgi:Mrp family chromosome partitioning ATPase/capsular polysaccharide biosynthesis protein